MSHIWHKDGRSQREKSSQKTCYALQGSLSSNVELRWAKKAANVAIFVVVAPTLLMRHWLASSV